MRVGIDSVEIDRIQKSFEINGFFEKAYSPAEREFLSAKKNPYSSAAANFAAKEAFSKALGTGFSGFELKDVEILRDGLGKPFVEVGESLTEKLNGKRIFVSISHSEKYAVANVIIEE